MLCTKPELFWDIIWLDNRPDNYEKRDWRVHIRDINNLHKINYCASIIDSFITCDLTQYPKDSYDYKYRQDWTRRFLE